MLYISGLLVCWLPLIAFALQPWEPADPENYKNIPYPFAGFNRSSLVPAKDGTAVIVPDEYWQTAQYFNLRYSPALWRFLDTPVPSPKTQLLADWIKNASQLTPYLQVLCTGLTGSVFAPSINGMSRAYALWRWNGRMDTPWTYCRCNGGPECSPKNLAYKQMEQPPWQYGVHYFFDALVDMLANKAIVPQLEALSISDLPPSEEDKLVANAAEISLGPTQNLRVQLTKLQYALYQQLVRGDSECPIPIVECGKNSNPCDHYPWANRSTARERSSEVRVLFQP